jgi:hypothetical protein
MVFELDISLALNPTFGSDLVARCGRNGFEILSSFPALLKGSAIQE